MITQTQVKVAVTAFKEAKNPSYSVENKVRIIQIFRLTSDDTNVCTKSVPIGHEGYGWLAVPSGVATSVSCWIRVAVAATRSTKRRPQLPGNGVNRIELHFLFAHSTGTWGVSYLCLNDITRICRPESWHSMNLARMSGLNLNESGVL